MTITKKFYLTILLLMIYAVFTAGDPLWAKQSSGRDLNLTPDQVKALDSVVNELNEKQFQIAVNIQRTVLELKLELNREDRFATDTKAKESAGRTNQLIKRLTGLYGDMLKLEVEYVLKAKDVLTRAQRVQLIESLDFDMEAPEGWMQEQEIEVLAVDLELSEEQQKKILRYRTQMKKKEASIERKMVKLEQDLEDTLSKDKVDDKKVNRIILSLTDLGVEMLNNRVEHRLKAKDVLTVAQKKKLLHALFMASGF